MLFVFIPTFTKVHRTTRSPVLHPCVSTELMFSSDASHSFGVEMNYNFTRLSVFINKYQIKDNLYTKSGLSFFTARHTYQLGGLQWKWRGLRGQRRKSKIMSTDIMDDVFDRALSSSGLIQNSSVLRSDYIPERLPFREDQIRSVAEILAPILKNSKPSNLLLYGKTGTGKTVVTHRVLKHLQKAATKTSKHITLAYCNSRVAGTEYRVLSQLANAIGVDIPFTGLALSEVFTRILKHVNQSQTNVIFTIDEVDFLVKHSGDDLLYEFTRSNSEIFPASLSLVGISNDLQFKDLLDPRVLSSLSEEEIMFTPYTADELRTILKERSLLAFPPGRVAEAAINLCAALAASEHGDARRAVDLLRVAAEIAERKSAEALCEEHIRLALQHIEQDRIGEAVHSLPLHTKLLLTTIMLNHDTHSTGEIYESYRGLTERIGTEPLTQRRVSGLLAELDMLGLITTNIISKGRYGRTKSIHTQIPKARLRDLLSEDPILKDVKMPY